MKSSLIVDDSRIVRKVARRIFEGLGYECEEAAEGAAALAICAQKIPDFILLDWNMPVMNGLEFLTALRQKPEAAQCVVVFCTTENDIGHIRRALDQGASEYIMKPFDEEIVKSKLSSLGLLSE